MKLKKKFLTIVVVATICIGIGFKFTVLDNPDFLCKVAEGFDEPSKPFYLVIERIYKLSEKKKFEERLIKYLNSDENRYLHDIYIRILGVIGKKISLHDLEKIYIKNQHNKKYKATLFYVIRSMGLIGTEEIVPFLETLLDKYGELQVQVSGSNIASALFLITGNDGYIFTDSQGEQQKLYLTEALIEARRVIKASRGRDRTFNEMLVLDRLYRPPDWR